VSAAARPIPLTHSRILQAYAAKTPGSARLFARAKQLFPDGVTHVGRYLQPHPLYVSRAAGPRKWDVDGNEYVDYFGGHGALLLGHNHPAVMEAVTAQLARGTHYGASHDLEIEWAELIREMVPSAERVRFTSSGTEATLLAIRLARAATGRPVVIRITGHFHGWHDQVAFGPAGAPGILQQTPAGVLLCPPGDLDAVREACESRHDIAAVILEPTGATFGQIPVTPQHLTELRAITARHGIVLIFDEVITGFRCSPGGAQAYYKVTPDLTTLAKIVAGGFPGAALAGRADLLSWLEHRSHSEKVQAPPVLHQGTFNAAPLSAAAGIATLRLIRDTDVIARANRAAAALRTGMNRILRARGVPWCVYGEFSGFHIFPNTSGTPVAPEDIYAGRVPWPRLKGAAPVELLQKIRAGFLARGVDVIGWPGGVVSAVHGELEVDRTVAAFEGLLGDLAAEGELH
jgi:glutamate-1-semialdehyde 2,1-aminomutase